MAGNEKNISARIQHKHDIEANWEKAINFIPKQGEIIVYDIDANYNYERFKIGDGVTTISNLLFTTSQADWNQNDPSKPDFIKNRICSVEERKETIVYTYDGNYEDKESVLIDEYKRMIKVSDNTPLAEDLINGTIIMCHNGEDSILQITETDIGKLPEILGDANGYSVHEGVIMVSFDDVVFNSTILSKGIWFYEISVPPIEYYMAKELRYEETIKTYNTIDENYIPNTIARSSDVAQADWNQNDPLKPDYIKNRICSIEERKETVTYTYIYDGNYDDKEYIDMSPSIRMIKISDDTPLAQDIIGGTVLVHSNGVDGFTTITEDLIGPLPEILGNVSGYSLGEIMVGLEDVVVGDIVCTKGIWIYDYQYLSSRVYGLSYEKTIKTYNTINENYIPDTIARSADVAQADWNQNDETAPDYVKNRPFYSLGDMAIEDVIFAETTVENNFTLGSNNAYAIFPSPFVLEDDNDYKVVYDGVAYNLHSFSLHDPTTGLDFVAIGNASLYNSDLENTGESICVGYTANNPEFNASTAAFIYEDATATSHTISVSKITISEGIKKIDEKYLPPHSWDNLEDKPFGYSKRAELINQTITTGKLAGYNVALLGEKNSILTVGKIYDVVLDGILYPHIQCLYQSEDDDYYIGNPTIMERFSDAQATDHPFLIIDDNTGTTIIILNNELFGDHDLAIYVYEELKQIDKIFIPNTTSSDVIASNILTTMYELSENASIDDVFEMAAGNINSTLNDIKEEVSGSLNKIKTEILVTTNNNIKASIADWNQSNSSETNFIKNRTHFDEWKSVTWDGSDTEIMADDYCLVETDDATFELILNSPFYSFDVTSYGQNPDWNFSTEEERENMEEYITSEQSFLEQFGNRYDKYIVFIDELVEDPTNNIRAIIVKEDNTVMNVTDWAGATFETLFPKKGLYVWRGAISDAGGNLWDMWVSEFRYNVVAKQLDEKYIPDSIARIADIAQADWNQNDETASNYIKNRTHYEAEKIFTYKRGNMISWDVPLYFADSSDEVIDAVANASVCFVGDGATGSADFETYKVSFDNYILLFSNPNLEEMNSFWSLGGLVVFEDNTTITLGSVSYTFDSKGLYLFADDTGYTGSLCCGDIKQLDEKYIPDSIARKSDIPSIEGLASESYVNTQIANLVNSAPDKLNTLDELAAALGDDENFANTVTTQLANKVEKINGMGLSSNDFTDAEKEKLANIKEITSAEISALFNN